MKHLLIFLLLLAGCSPAELDYRAQMDTNFQELLETCDSASFYGTNEDCIQEFLLSKGDLFCEEDVCWGGNSVGEFRNFYK